MKAIGAVTLVSMIPGLTAARATPAPRHGAQEAKKNGAPKYKSAWKMDLPAGTTRVAIADVTEDKKPRLLVLDKDGTLTISKLSDTGTAKESTVALGKDASRFVTGHFAAGKPALIVAPGAVFYKDGEKYSKKEAPELTEITGSARFIDGTEVVFVLAQGGPPTSYGIELAAEKPLTPGKELPQPDPSGGQFREIVANLPSEMLEQEPFPEPVKKGGIVRLIDSYTDNRIFGLVSWQEGDASYVAILEAASLFPQPVADSKPIWKSPKMSGKVLDISMGPDPKGSKQTGFLVLTASGEDGKGRTAEFFALE
jgi:hypothetical protein